MSPMLAVSSIEREAMFSRKEAFPVFTGLPFMRVFRGPLADEVQSARAPESLFTLACTLELLCLFHEVHQAVGSWISQRTRLARGARHVEITYTVSHLVAPRIPWARGAMGTGGV